MLMLAYLINKKGKNTMLEEQILMVMEVLIWDQAFQVDFHQEELLECLQIWEVVQIQMKYLKCFSNKVEDLVDLEVLVEWAEWVEKIKQSLVLAQIMIWTFNKWDLEIQEEDLVALVIILDSMQEDPQVINQVILRKNDKNKFNYLYKYKY